MIEVLEVVKQGVAIRARTNKGWTTLFHPDKGSFLTKVEEVLVNKVNEVIDDAKIELTSKVSKFLDNPSKVHQRCVDVKEFLKSKYPNGFNLDSLGEVCAETMRYVAHMKRLTGGQKRKFVWSLSFGSSICLISLKALL